MKRFFFPPWGRSLYRPYRRHPLSLVASLPPSRSRGSSPMDDRAFQAKTRCAHCTAWSAWDEFVLPRVSSRCRDECVESRRMIAKKKNSSSAPTHDSIAMGTSPSTALVSDGATPECRCNACGRVQRGGSSLMNIGARAHDTCVDCRHASRLRDPRSGSMVRFCSFHGVLEDVARFGNGSHHCEEAKRARAWQGVNPTKRRRHASDHPSTCVAPLGATRAPARPGASSPRPQKPRDPMKVSSKARPSPSPPSPRRPTTPDEVRGKRVSPPVKTARQVGSCGGGGCDAKAAAGDPTDRAVGGGHAAHPEQAKQWDRLLKLEKRKTTGELKNRRQRLERRSDFSFAVPQTFGC